MKTAILILILSFSAFGQDTKPTPETIAVTKTIPNESAITSVIEKTPDVEQAEARISQITADAARFFKEGLFNIQDNRRSQAREGFDKSVEVFLMSTVSVSDSPKLSGCYTQLIETIYRMEFPSAQTPQIKSLSEACAWDIDNALADGVIAKLAQKPVQLDAAKTNLALRTSGGTAPEIAQGFNEQKFESPIGDEMARPVLTEELPKLKTSASPTTYITVIAQSDDTVMKLAQRYNASPVEVAKFNNLFLNSVLPKGRIVKIPAEYSAAGGNYARPRLTDNTTYRLITPVSAPETILLGARPNQEKDGKVRVVMNYFDENFNDPYSMRFVKWSNVVKIYIGIEPFWGVQVRFRAKNAFNAYILSEMIFYIRKNKVVSAKKVF